MVPCAGNGPEASSRLARSATLRRFVNLGCLEGVGDWLTELIHMLDKVQFYLATAFLTLGGCRILARSRRVTFFASIGLEK